MVHLNYTNLDAQTQENLIAISIKDIERKFGEQLKAYAKEYQLNYDTLLQEEALLNLYNYSYDFTI